MNATITCRGCGTVLGIPKTGMPADGLSCVWCGAMTTGEAAPKPAPEAPPPKAKAPPPPVPVPMPTTKPPAEAEPAPAPPKKELAWWAEDEDDDGTPYNLPAEEAKTKKCDACAKEIDAKAFICVHCGHDERTQAKVERNIQPIDREWEAGWPFERRLTLFIIAQVLNLVTFLIITIGGSSLGTGIVGVGFTVFLQAFLLGTYDKIRVRRNKKGQVEIVQTWRYCFIPAAPKKLQWKQHEGVAFGVYDGSSLLDWWMVLVLIPFFILPAILWWWFVIEATRFYTALARDLGYPDVYLYRGKNEAQAREMAQVVSDATGLRPTTKLE